MLAARWLPPVRNEYLFLESRKVAVCRRNVFSRLRLIWDTYGCFGEATIPNVFYDVRYNKMSYIPYGTSVNILQSVFDRENLRLSQTRWRCSFKMYHQVTHGETYLGTVLSCVFGKCAWETVRLGQAISKFVPSDFTRKSWFLGNRKPISSLNWLNVL